MRDGPNMSNNSDSGALNVTVASYSDWP